MSWKEASFPGKLCRTLSVPLSITLKNNLLMANNKTITFCYVLEYLNKKGKVKKMYYLKIGELNLPYIVTLDPTVVPNSLGSHIGKASTPFIACAVVSQRLRLHSSTDFLYNLCEIKNILYMYSTSVLKLYILMANK